MPCCLDLSNTYRVQWERATDLNLEDEIEHYQTLALRSYQQAIAVAPAHLQRIQAQTNLMGLMIDGNEHQQSTHPSAELNPPSSHPFNENAPIIDLWHQLKPELTQLPASRTGLEVKLNAIKSLLNFNDVNKQHPQIPPIPWHDIITPLQQTIHQAQQLQDRRSESLALGYLGHLYERVAQWQDAKTVTTEAIALSEAIHAPDIQYRWEWQLGRILKHQSETSKAIDTYRQAIQTLDTVRQDLLFVNADIQFSFRDDVEPVYRELVDLLLQTPNPSPSALNAAIGYIDTLQLSELENFLDCDLSSTVELSKAEVGAHAAIFYTIIVGDTSSEQTNQRLEVILKLPNQSTVLHHSITPPSDINQTLDTLRYGLEQDYLTEDVDHAASDLYQWLIQPQEKALEDSGVDTLVFVLDGALRSVPMATLRNEHQQYLIENYAIALAPRLQLQNPQAFDPQHIDTLFLGLSEISSPFRAQFRPLPFVASEARIVEAATTPSQIRLNDDFTNVQFRQDIQDHPFSVIHFATHGEFSSDPDHTFLLAWDTRITSNDLRTTLQTRQQRYPIDLLILSACKTADGDNRATLGLAGIAFQAGAESTVASLWVINDETTALFIDTFYQALTNRTNPTSRAKALQTAQLALLNKGYVPYYWAPFVLVGNWL